MFRRTIFLTMLIITVVSWGASAQFSIKKQTEAETNQLDLFKGSLQSDMTNTYYDEARIRDERRKKRKARNTVDFTADLKTTLQQFDNWTAGGDNTFTGLATLYFRHQFTPGKFSNDFSTNIRYGINVIEKKPFKNVDEVKIQNNTKWQMHKAWSYSALITVRSQMTDGYVSRTDSTLKSSFFAPGYIDAAVGFTYSKGAWNITISPLSGNMITMLDSRLNDKDRFGVKAGKRVLNQIGPSVNINFDKTFGKKKIVRYRTSVYSFTNLSNDPTVRWENTLNINLTKYISASFYGQAYYLKSASTSVQFQYQTSIGLTYSFRNK